MSEPQEEYVLGCDHEELTRLGRQHSAWVEQMYAVLRKAGLRSGQAALDLGSGPGFTTFELSSFVGKDGRVEAVDENEGFIKALRHFSEARGHTNIEARVCKVESPRLQAESLDCVYGRWILSWLSDASVVFEEVYQALKPGGCYVLQEYLDWGAMKLLPRDDDFDAGIFACMKSWEVSGGFINASQRVPELAAAAGFEIEHFEVQARTGRPGSLVWGWLNDFYASYLPRLVERGLLDEKQLEEFSAVWRAAGRDLQSVVIAPVMADIIVRKPVQLS